MAAERFLRRTHYVDDRHTHLSDYVLGNRFRLRSLWTAARQPYGLYRVRHEFVTSNLYRLPVVPGSPVWPSGNPNYATVEAMQQAYDSIFTLPGILIFASMTAYLIAQLMDVRLFHFCIRVTHGRHLWLAETTF